MKKNISILVLFGLLLAFGVLAASCDNGVLPKHEYDEKHLEGEYDPIYVDGSINAQGVVTLGVGYGEIDDTWAKIGFIAAYQKLQTTSSGDPIILKDSEGTEYYYALVEAETAGYTLATGVTPGFVLQILAP